MLYPPELRARAYEFTARDGQAVSGRGGPAGRRIGMQDPEGERWRDRQTSVAEMYRSIQIFYGTI